LGFYTLDKIPGKNEVSAGTSSPVDKIPVAQLYLKLSFLAKLFLRKLN